MPAKSKAHQKLFATALSVKRGETPKNKVSSDVLKIVDTMTEKDIKDYAETPTKGLPNKVETVIREMVKEELQRLNEAEEIHFDELPATQKKQANELVKLFRGKIEEIWSGIHGYIIIIKKTSHGVYRFDNSQLKQLVKLDVRWVEGDNTLIRIGL
jgi:hypothetical protein